MRSQGELIGTLADGRPDPAFGTGGYVDTPYVPVGDIATAIWALPMSGGRVISAVEETPLQPPSVPTTITIRAYTASGSPAESPRGPDVAHFDLANASGRSQYSMADALAGPGATVEIIVAGKRGLDLYRRVG